MWPGLPIPINSIVWEKGDLTPEPHREGSVTNLRDRRHDLYSLDWKNKG